MTENIAYARRWVEHLGLKLERRAKWRSEDGPRWAVVDPWQPVHTSDVPDLTAGRRPSAIVLERVTLAEVWDWIRAHEPLHTRIIWDAREAWRVSIGLPTREELGEHFLSEFSDEDAEEGDDTE
ncbi:MAG: hypothetical protein J0I14_04325 [Propionibacteriaceae bacterium]|jgi:hypothetical protein|nr:hypothetical protein [Propionibacteriaceae bacterium]